jgi:hypothetical protein
MKRSLISAVIAVILLSTMMYQTVYAWTGQWSNSGSTIFYNEGVVELSSSSTQYDALRVYGSTATPTGDRMGKILVGDGPGSWWIQGNYHINGMGYNNIASNAYYNNGWKRRTPGRESWVIQTYVTDNNTTGTFTIQHSTPEDQTNISNMAKLFEISANGTTFVKGLVVSQGGWPDYVFEDGYALKSIKEVEKYIEENKRLPGVPSEAEITKNGLNVGDMQKIQMEKIEELTLYLIKQEKTIKDLEQRLERLESK